MLAADAVAPDTLLALQEALASHSWVVAAVIGVLILAPLILTAFGVKVPFLEPLVNVLIAVAKSFNKKPTAPAAPPEPVKGTGAVAEVHDINELKNKGPFQ